MEKFRIVCVCEKCGKTKTLERRVPVHIEELLPGWVTAYDLENKRPVYYCDECSPTVGV